VFPKSLCLIICITVSSSTLYQNDSQSQASKQWASFSADVRGVWTQRPSQTILDYSRFKKTILISVNKAQNHFLQPIHQDFSDDIHWCMYWARKLVKNQKP